MFTYHGGSLQNAGQITSSDYNGVFFYNGGTVTNTGSIGGAQDGINLGTAYNSVSNTGTVFNSGVVTGGVAGIYGYGSAFFGAEFRADQRRCRRAADRRPSNDRQ